MIGIIENENRFHLGDVNERVLENQRLQNDSPAGADLPLVL
jgi:hypothetical protein